MFRTHNITVQQMQADESLVPIAGKHKLLLRDFT